MRLTILSRDAPPMPGGIADHTALMATGLARLGNDVTLMTRVGADPIEGVDVWTHRRFDRMPVTALVTTLAAGEPDAVLWAYNPFSFGAKGLALRAARIARLLRHGVPNSRIVVLAHELSFPRSVEGIKGAIWSAAQRRALRIVLAHCDAVIVTTPDRHAALGQSAALIPVGSNLPDRVVAIDDALEIRASLGVPEGALLIAHMGGVGPGRDLGTTFAALRGLDESTHLVLAGETGPLAIPPDLATRVHAPGRDTPDRLAAVLSSADAYLHLDPVGPTPGRRTTLVAAMQAALPLIAFDGDQTDPRLAEAGAVRLVPVRDPDALAEAIGTLATDAAERARLGRNARALYERDFAWGRITLAVQAVLTGECNPPSSQTSS